MTDYPGIVLDSADKQYNWMVSGMTNEWRADFQMYFCVNWEFMQIITKQASIM